ncbi:hypothetical protein HIM_02153 [Hirsutella minnesotensis 3608]|nr:hypothetical protein HIM_02153 [Hirsutella minnesotensis 3608]
MPPPSPLVIATGSVQRLLKEEASYHKELSGQEARVRALEEKIKSGQGNDDGNAEFTLKQEKTAVEETKAVFGPLRERIDAAVAKLEEQIAVSEHTVANPDELDQARAVLGQAKRA